MTARSKPAKHELSPGSAQTYRSPDEVLADRLARPADLRKNLALFKRNRATLARFIRDVLEEAAYDAQGAPLPGQLHDYYRIPGANRKALTKLGAEKLAGLCRYARGETKIVDSVETPEYVSATVSVVLVDQYRRVVGSGEAACATAEAGFRSIRAQRRYGAVITEDGTVEQPPDYRAALHDVIARAGKRAFVQAVIYATATDELFTVADQPDEEEAAAAGARAPEAGVGRLPQNKFGKYAGQRLADVPAEDLATIAHWCRHEVKKAAAWAPVAEAIDQELERRRLAADDGGEDLPF